MSMRRTSSATMALAGLILSLGLLAACQPDGGSSGTPGGGGSGVRLAITINPASAEGRVSASVKIDSDVALTGGQLSFTLPEGCRTVAGAAVRAIPEVAPGRTTSQEIAFECSAGVSPTVKAEFAGRDGSGKDYTATAEAKP